MAGRHQIFRLVDVARNLRVIRQSSCRPSGPKPTASAVSRSEARSAHASAAAFRLARQPRLAKQRLLAQSVVRERACLATPRLFSGAGEVPRASPRHHLTAASDGRAPPAPPTRAAEAAFSAWSAAGTGRTPARGARVGGRRHSRTLCQARRSRRCRPPLPGAATCRRLAVALPGPPTGDAVPRARAVRGVAPECKGCS